MDLEAIKNIRWMIFDVDGVMTDGNLYYTDSGEEIKAFSALDGQGLQLLQRSGVGVAIITGRESALLSKRAKELGIRHLYQGADDKLAAFEQLQHSVAVSAQACGYMGDDLVDLPVMRRCAYRVAPPTAHSLVQQYADYITQAAAGQGAVREVCEQIMQVQGTWSKQLAFYLR